MSTVSTGDFKKKLVKKFVPNYTKESKSQIIQDLYNQYKKSLSAPKLTTQNLISAMRYIKKHNYKESEYGKAIKKTASKSSALTLNQFADIYDYIMKKRNVKYSLNRNNVLSVYNWIINSIIKTINKGNKIRLSQFGTFEGMMRQARTYRIPNSKNKKDVVKVGAHLVPKFRPSAVWKRQLRNKK